ARKAQGRGTWSRRRTGLPLTVAQGSGMEKWQNLADDEPRREAHELNPESIRDAGHHDDLSILPPLEADPRHVGGVHRPEAAEEARVRHVRLFGEMRRRRTRRQA